MSGDEERDGRRRSRSESRGGAKRDRTSSRKEHKEKKEKKEKKDRSRSRRRSKDGRRRRDDTDKPFADDAAAAAAPSYARMDSGVDLGSTFGAGGMLPSAALGEDDSTVLYGDAEEATEDMATAAPQPQPSLLHAQVATPTTTRYAETEEDPALGGQAGDAEAAALAEAADSLRVGQTAAAGERTVVRVAGMDNMLPDPLVVNPVVRFWVVDGRTGYDVTHHGGGDPAAYGGFFSNPCDLRDVRSCVPQWDETVPLGISLQRVVDARPDAMLLFEVIDCSKQNVQRQRNYFRNNYGPGYGRVFYPVCWGFLRLQAADGSRKNCTGTHRVQMYRSPMRRSLLKGMLLRLWPSSVYPSAAAATVPGAVQRGEPAVPPLFMQYVSRENRLDRYPAALHVKLSREDEADDLLPFGVPLRRDLEELLLECRRALHPVHAGDKGRRASLVSAASDELVHDEPVALLDCTRGRAEKCRLPGFLQASLSGGKKGCLAMAFSPCGRFLAVAACDELRVEIRVHDTKFGPKPGEEGSEAARLACPQVASFDGHTNTVYQLLWSPSGRHLLSCSADFTAKQWPFEECCSFDWGQYPTIPTLRAAVQSGSLVANSCADYTFIHPCQVYTAVYHSLGEMVVTGGFDDTIRCWSVVTGRLMHACVGAPKSWVAHLAISSDGSMLYSADGSSELKMWTVSGLTRAKEPKLDLWATITDFKGKGISHLVPNTAAKLLYVWTRVDSAVTSINTSTYSRFAQVRKYRGPRFEGCAIRGCLSPCGTVLSTGSGKGPVFFWETGTGDFVGHDHTGLDCEHSGPVYVSAWSPTDHRMAFSSYSARLNLITIWCLPSDEPGAAAATGAAAAVSTERSRGGGAEPLSFARVMSGSMHGGRASPSPLGDDPQPRFEELDTGDADWMNQIIVQWSDRVSQRAHRLITAGTAVEVAGRNGALARAANVTGWTEGGLCVVEYSDAQGGRGEVNPVHVKRLRAASAVCFFFLIDFFI